MTPLEIAHQVRETMGTAGWKHIEAIIQARLRYPEERFAAAWAKDPEKVNKNVVIKWAAYANGVRDTKEDILDLLKPLNSPQPARAGTQ